MSHITLAVTTKVMAQVRDGHNYQQQLAIRDASDDLQGLLKQASKQNIVTVALCQEFILSVGDTAAIWAVHQQSEQQRRDFADLYSLLSRRPDTSVTFNW